jgi:hypothetical protein
MKDKTTVSFVLPFLGAEFSETMSRAGLNRRVQSALGFGYQIKDVRVSLVVENPGGP